MDEDRKSKHTGQKVVHTREKSNVGNEARRSREYGAKERHGGGSVRRGTDAALNGWSEKTY